MSKYKGKHPKWRPPKGPGRGKGPFHNPKPLPSENVSVRAYSTQTLIKRHTGQTQSKLTFLASRVQSRIKGENVPDYKKKIREHKSATSSFSGTTFKNTSKQYSCQFGLTDPHPEFDEDVVVAGERVGTGDGLSLISDLPTTPPSLSGATYTSAYNRAVQKLYDKIRNMESSTPIGEDIGEYHQTVNLFKRGLGGIRDLIDYTMLHHKEILKKGYQWRNTKRVVKSLGDLTLEYRFGIEPLAKDLGEGLAALTSDKFLDAFLPFTARSSATSTAKNYDEPWSSFPALHVLTFTDSNYMVRFKGEYRIRSKSAYPSFARSLGLTWRESLPTLWNLLPYSFLLDYVTNLHTYVEALTIPFSNVAWCVGTFRSKRVNRRFYDFRVGEQNSDLFIKHQTPGYFISTATGIIRSEQADLPLPILAFKPPKLRALENTLALAAGRLPIIGALTKRLLTSPSGKDLNYKFQLAVRDRNLKVPYPYHRS